MLTLASCLSSRFCDCAVLSASAVSASSRPDSPAFCVPKSIVNLGLFSVCSRASLCVLFAIFEAWVPLNSPFSFPYASGEFKFSFPRPSFLARPFFTAPSSSEGSRDSREILSRDDVLALYEFRSLVLVVV